MDKPIELPFGVDPVVHGEHGAIKLRPLDIVNSVPRFGFNLRSLVAWRIQRFQRRMLGPAAFVKSTHTRVYLGRGTLTEFTWPRAQFVQFGDIALDGRLRVLRYRRADMASLAPEVMQAVLSLAYDVNGKRYDLAELFRFLASEAAGFGLGPGEILKAVIDGGGDNFVCSTYAATLFRVARHAARRAGYEVPKLFGGLPVEMTTPAHFDNAPADFQMIYNFETDF